MLYELWPHQRTLTYLSPVAACAWSSFQHGFNRACNRRNTVARINQCFEVASKLRFYYSWFFPIGASHSHQREEEGEETPYEVSVRDHSLFSWDCCTFLNRHCDSNNTGGNDGDSPLLTSPLLKALPFLLPSYQALAYHPLTLTQTDLPHLPLHLLQQQVYWDSNNHKLPRNPWSCQLPDAEGSQI